MPDTASRISFSLPCQRVILQLRKEGRSGVHCTVLVTPSSSLHLATVQQRCITTVVAPAFYAELDDVPNFDPRKYFPLFTIPILFHIMNDAPPFSNTCINMYMWCAVIYSYILHTREHWRLDKELLYIQRVLALEFSPRIEFNKIGGKLGNI